MAIHAPITGAPLGAPPIAFDVLPRRARRLLATIERDEIDAAIEVLIARLDALSGDPDLELTGSEDDFMRHRADGPGCPIADPDHCPSDDDHLNWVHCDGAAGDPEDAEDDDPAGDPLDEGEMERGHKAIRPRYAVDQSLGPINANDIVRAHFLASMEEIDPKKYQMGIATPARS